MPTGRAEGTGGACACRAAPDALVGTVSVAVLACRRERTRRSVRYRHVPACTITANTVVSEMLLSRTQIIELEIKPCLPEKNLFCFYRDVSILGHPSLTMPIVHFETSTSITDLGSLQRDQAPYTWSAPSPQHWNHQLIWPVPPLCAMLQEALDLVFALSHGLYLLFQFFKFRFHRSHVVICRFPVF